MDNNMITTFEWDDEKLYGQFQALKNQLVHTSAHSDSVSPAHMKTHINTHKHAHTQIKCES